MATRGLDGAPACFSGGDETGERGGEGCAEEGEMDEDDSRTLLDAFTWTGREARGVQRRRHARHGGSSLPGARKKTALSLGRAASVSWAHLRSAFFSFFLFLFFFLSFVLFS